jgi:hypothetical protein
VITAVLSLSMQRMARNGAIIRRPSALETLGSATVIASDRAAPWPAPRGQAELMEAEPSLGFFHSSSCTP